MINDPDASAMIRLAGGEDLALNEIMSRWQDRLASFIWHMTQDEAITRDLAQETFVRLYQSRHRYKPKAPFASYLFRITRNLIYNHQRWVKRHPSESLQVLRRQGFDSEAETPAPDEAIRREETARAVRSAIASLPEDLRMTLVLFTYQGLGYREISTILDCTEKAVETRIYRARQILKEKLAHLADEVNEA